MITFLIQTVNEKVEHDFSFILLKAIAFNNWLRNDVSFLYIECDLIDNINNKNMIPIGSVEFVLSYIDKFYDKKIKPRNIPETLFPFAHRNIVNGTEKDVKINHFVKSNDNIKSFTELITSTTKVPSGNYQISEFIDILSEYRCFVYNGKLLGIHNYSGNFTIFPSVDAIQQMITSYTDAPIAYTLDVGINNTSTFVIEVHDFFSCGLYGFADYKNLPIMFCRAFNNLIK